MGENGNTRFRKDKDGKITLNALPTYSNDAFKIVRKKSMYMTLKLYINRYLWTDY